MALGVGVTLWVGLAALRGGYLAPAGAPPIRREPLDPAAVVVLDGDTLATDGRIFRLLAVDTPERGAPWFDGDQEPWASLAKARTRHALDAAREVVLLSRGERDVHQRELVHVLVDGRPLAALLVADGLAYCTVARYGDSGFPELAEAALRAARPPPFEPPWRWRARHRIPEE